MLALFFFATGPVGWRLDLPCFSIIMPRDVFSPDGHAAFMFDMDGTLLSSIAAAERVWQRWAIDHGLDPASFLPTIHGKRAIETIRDSGVADIDPEIEAEAILVAEIEDVADIEPIAGAAAFLAALPADRWAVVTSAPRRLAEARLTAAGLPSPRVLICGDDVARGKPAPDAFVLGARRLGVPVTDCLIFEDAAVGIAAAKAAEAALIVVTAGHATPLAAAGDQIRIDDYARIPVSIAASGRLVVDKPAGPTA